MPRNALVICFGVGLTAGAISTYPDARLTVVELSETILSIADKFTDINEHVTDSVRTHIVVDDGRNYLIEKANQPMTS